MSNKALVRVVGLWVGLVVAGVVHANTVSSARQQYGEAMRAIDRGHWTEYERIRPGLDDYPLAIYLDYTRMVRQPSSVSPPDVRLFISLSQDTPLPNRYLGIYLSRAGRDKRWNDFLAAKSEEPNDITLKCYYFRARLATGSKAEAWEGAARLWVPSHAGPALPLDNPYPSKQTGSWRT